MENPTAQPKPGSMYGLEVASCVMRGGGEDIGEAVEGASRGERKQKKHRETLHPIGHDTRLHPSITLRARDSVRTGSGSRDLLGTRQAADVRLTARAGQRDRRGAFDKGDKLRIQVRIRQALGRDVREGRQEDRQGHQEGRHGGCRSR